MIDQYNTLSEKFLRKGFWLYLFWFIIGPIWYIIKIIISWELSVNEVWILYGIISLLTLISSYNDLWMTESLKHFIPIYVNEKRYDKVKSILFYAFFLQIITSLIIAAFFYFWSDIIANSYFKSEIAINSLKIFAFFFIWLNLFQTISSFFLAVQNTFFYKSLQFIRILFVMVSIIIIYSLDLSTLENYSYSWLIWLYIWLLISLLLFYKRYYKSYFYKEKFLIEKKLVKTTFRYAFFILLSAWAWSILSQIDMQMIIYILWTEDAWYYTNYLSIIWIPFLIIWPIFWFLFPVFSEMYSKWEIKKIKLVKEILIKNSLIFSIITSFFFFIFAETITYILFWEKFLKSAEILKYSIFFLIFNFLLQVNENIMLATWKVKERIKIIFAAIVLNFIINLIFINLLWVIWAALATWIWWIFIYTLWEYFLWKKYSSKIDYKILSKNLVFMWTLSFFTYKFWLYYFTWLSRINSLLLIFLFFIIWFCVFFITNYNDLKGVILEIKKLRK